MRIVFIISRDSKGQILFVRFLSEIRSFQARVRFDGVTETLILDPVVNNVSTDWYTNSGWTILEL